MIRLTAVIDLEAEGRRALTFESSSKSFVIGRDAKADFQIPLTTISRAHARIVETDNVYVFEDLGSTHGSLINGQKLDKGEKKVLRDGDLIELTKAKITCNINIEQVIEHDSGENTRMIADRAVQGILGRLGDDDDSSPFVRILSGPDEGQRLTLSGGLSQWTLGRSKDSHLVLNDSNISRKHAIIERGRNGFLIQDLGSKNGIQINGKRYRKPRLLKDQDEIGIGPMKLLFIDPDAELMAALQGVPGFEVAGPEVEEMEEDPSVVGAPLDPSADLAEEHGLEGDDPTPFEEEEDPYADIDPSLLESQGSKLPSAILISFGLALIVAVGLLLALLLTPA